MRVCFVLQIRPEKAAEYKERHSKVWPEMMEALKETGWRNYSIFMRPDGLLVGYVESDDFEKSTAEMKKHPVNARWQAEMVPFFERLEGSGPDDSMFPLEEIFHLD